MNEEKNWTDKVAPLAEKTKNAVLVSGAAYLIYSLGVAVCSLAAFVVSVLAYGVAIAICLCAILWTYKELF